MLTIPPLRVDPAEIQRAVRLIVEPGALVELRAPKSPQGVLSGYYLDLDALVRDAVQWSGIAEALYVTLNPVHADLRARAFNHVSPYARHTTADRDILRRRWLLVDCDPVRPAGVSATDAEHQAALRHADQVRDWLRERGWPEPLCADSGNGAHLLYRVDLPNDDASRTLLEGVLAALAAELRTDRVLIDPSTFNASRISKLYGTLAAKGDNVPDMPGSPGRLHRLAVIRAAVEPILPVSASLLQDVAGLRPALVRSSGAARATGTPGTNGSSPAPKGAGDYETLDVVAWFTARGHYGRAMGGGKHAVLCPWHSQHSDVRKAEESDTTVWEASPGRWPEFHCLHAHCTGRGIRDVIDLWPDADRHCQSSFGGGASWPVRPAPTTMPVDDPAPVPLPVPPPPEPVGLPPAPSAAGDHFAIEQLRKLTTDPPRFFVTIWGVEIEVPSVDLMEFKRLKLVCLERLSRIPMLPVMRDVDGKKLSEQRVYEQHYLQPALATATQVEEAPPDAGTFGAAWDDIRAFFAGTRAVEDRAELEADRLVREEDHYLFRGRQLRKWLATHRLDTLKPGELWSVIRSHGGEPFVARTTGSRSARVWRIPVAAVQPEPGEIGLEPGAERESECGFGGSAGSSEATGRNVSVTTVRAGETGQ